MALSSGYIAYAEWIRWGMIYLTLILTVFSGLHYIFSGLKILT
jgi:hypothetical protein